MANSPDHKLYASENPAVADYVERVFGGEDAILADIRRRAVEANMPAIHVSPFDGRHMEVLAIAAGARKIVEIGTLAGYSGVCLARALPADGVLHTFEYEKKHAEVAAESFKRAGVSGKVVIHQGAALDKLPAIESRGPFDLVFIDADKENYPNYLAWAGRNLRVGGMVLVDNAFAWGLLTLPENDPQLKDANRRKSREAIDATNRGLNATPGYWRSTMLPTGEGLAMGVKIRP